MTAQAARTRTGSRRRLSPEQRRAELLGTALRVFARSGLGQARHTEIALEAGVAASTVFVYFPTREALVAAVLGEVERFYMQLTEHTTALDLPPREALVRQAESFVAALETNPHHALVFLDWSTSFRAENWRRYLDFMDRLIQRFAETIRRGQSEGAIPPERDAEASARLFLGAAQMVVQMKVTGCDGEAIVRFTETVVDATLGERPDA